MSAFSDIIGPAVELAVIEDFPRLYGAGRPPRRGVRGFFDRVFARPGPKPLKTEITYRGKASMLARTLQRLGEYRESPISLETLDLMRHHPMVKLGLVVKAAPILTALREARIKCDDDRIAAFIKTAFVEPWLLKVGETSVLPSYIFGVAPHEKVWESKHVKAVYVDDDGNEQVAWDAPALVYKKVKFVHPMSLDRFLTQKGTQDYAGFVQIPPAGEEEKPLDAWKTFTFINRFIFGGLWGESEGVDIYPYWYYSEFFRALQADYLKYKAVPPIIGYAPVGIREDQDGNISDNLQTAGEILQAAYESLVVVLPDERDDRGNRRWGYEELRVGEHGEVYTRAIEELDVMILRGLVVPERTVTQNMAAVGSYNQASIHQERMLDAAKAEVDNFLRAVNAYLVPQLVEDHFGPDAPKCEIFVHGLSEALKEKYSSIVVTILQNDRHGIFSQQVLFRELLDLLNIPYTVGEVTPLPVPGIPGDNGEEDDGKQGTTDQDS